MNKLKGLTKGKKEKNNVIIDQEVIDQKPNPLTLEGSLDYPDVRGTLKAFVENHKQLVFKFNVTKSLQNKIELLQSVGTNIVIENGKILCQDIQSVFSFLLESDLNKELTRHVLFYPQLFSSKKLIVEIVLSFDYYLRANSSSKLKKLLKIMVFWLSKFTDILLQLQTNQISDVLSSELNELQMALDQNFTSSGVIGFKTRFNHNTPSKSTQIPTSLPKQPDDSDAIRLFPTDFSLHIDPVLNQYSTLTTYLNWCDVLSYWVTYDVLIKTTDGQRVNAIKHFIATAAHCFDNRNFNSVNTIIKGLSHYAVRRLKNVWVSLPQKEWKTFRMLSDNKPTIGELSGQVHPPCVPVISYYVDMIQSLVECHDETEWIDISFLSEIGSIVDLILTFAGAQYQFTNVAKIREFITSTIFSLPLSNVDLMKLSFSNEAL
ncbi:Ras-GEF domain-containing protein [Entamoeba marina]